MPSYFHSGDLGDAVYSLPSVRALGGGILYFGSRPWTRTRWEDGTLIGLLKPLIDRTLYAQAALHDGQWIDYDFSSFRNGGYKLGDTIVERQRRWVGADISLEPWLQAEPNKVEPIVINRAERWQGFDFPWKRIVEVFHDCSVFIGLPQEHEAFCREFGHVFYVPCGDLLEAAEVIAGCEVFIGNQSCCNAIANGLGKKIILEVCPYAPDCFLNKGTTFFSFNGEVDVEADGRRFVLQPRDGPFKTKVGGRILASDDRDKLRVMARSVHAFDGTFAFYEEVPIYA